MVMQAPGYGGGHVEALTAGSNRIVAFDGRPIECAYLHHPWCR
jgi:hypothetical protein